MSVETDIGNLRGLLDEYGMACMGLEGDIEALREELIFMKKNHEDELATLRAQLSGTNMSVEVGSTSGQDLHKILDDMRAQYEGLIAVNRANAEMAFNKQAESVVVQGAQQSQAASAAQSEMSETRDAMQSLMTELESLRGLERITIRSLEDQQNDTEDRTARDLASYTVHIQMLEGELGSVRVGINQQLKNYAELLNMKMKLEQEISTYRRLLEGEDSRLKNISSESSHSMQSSFSFGAGSKGESSSSYQSSSTTGSGSGSGAASSSVSSVTKSAGGSSTTGAITAVTSNATKTTSQTSSLSSDGASSAASNSVVVDNDVSSSSSTTTTTSSTTKEVVKEPEPKREEVKRTKTVIITQTIVDGKVVESTEEVAEKTLSDSTDA